MVSTKERFIVVSDVLTATDNMVILTDFRYWADREEELKRWCKDTNSNFSGMIVVFPDSQTLTAFCLRWS